MPCYGSIPCAFCFAPTDLTFSSGFRETVGITVEWGKLEWLGSVVMLTSEDRVIPSPTTGDDGGVVWRAVRYNPGLCTGISVDEIYYTRHNSHFLHLSCLKLIFKFLQIDPTTHPEPHQHNPERRAAIFNALAKLRLTAGKEDTFLSVAEQHHCEAVSEGPEGWHCQENISVCLEALIKTDKLWMWQDPKTCEKQQQRFIRFLRALKKQSVLL